MQQPSSKNELFEKLRRSNRLTPHELRFVFELVERGGRATVRQLTAALGKKKGALKTTVSRLRMKLGARDRSGISDINVGSYDSSTGKCQPSEQHRREGDGYSLFLVDWKTDKPQYRLVTASLFRTVKLGRRPFDFFAGRESERADVKKRLMGLGALVVVSGDGGIGKSSLAYQAISDLAVEDNDFEGVLRFEADTQGHVGIAAELVAAVTGARIPLHETLSLHEAYIHCLRRNRLLVVLDNVETDQAIEYLVPNDVFEKSSVLVTTRRTCFSGNQTEFFQLAKELTPDAVLKLWEVRSNQTAEGKARQLVDQVRTLLRGSPLAIDIALSLAAADDGPTLAEMAELLTESTERAHLAYAGRSVHQILRVTLRSLESLGDFRRDYEKVLLSLGSVAPEAFHADVVKEVAQVGNARPFLRYFQQRSLIRVLEPIDVDLNASPFGSQATARSERASFLSDWYSIHPLTCDVVRGLGRFDNGSDVKHVQAFVDFTRATCTKFEITERWFDRVSPSITRALEVGCEQSPKLALVLAAAWAEEWLSSGRYGEGVKWLRRVLKSHTESESTFPLLWVRTMFECCNAHHTGWLEGIHRASDQIISDRERWLASPETTRKQGARVAIALSEVLCVFGQLGQAENLLDVATVLREDLSDEHELFQTSVQRAELYRLQGRYPEALEAIQGVLRSTFCFGDPATLRDNLCRFAKFATDYGESDKAIELLTSSNPLGVVSMGESLLDWARKQEQRYFLAEILLEIGRAHARAKRFDDALEAMGNSIELSIKNRWHDLHGFALLEMARCNELCDNHGLAVEQLTEAKGVAFYFPNQGFTAQVLLNRGRSHLQLGNESKARRDLIRAKRLFEQIGHKHASVAQRELDKLVQEIEQ